MVCIYCGHGTEVTNSRPKARQPSVWRRRACKACVAQFSTRELPDYAAALSVQGLHGKLYAFSRDKLFLSLHRALDYRPDAIDSATDLTATVIGKLMRSGEARDGLLHTRQVASTAYHTLKRFDPLSAHTYKAYHRSALGA